MSRFTESDVGKTVINPVGEEVGIVDVVEDGVAYVDTHPNWSDRIEASLGWTDDPDVDEAALTDEHIEEITDDQVRLREDLQVDYTGAD